MTQFYTQEGKPIHNPKILNFHILTFQNLKYTKMPVLTNRTFPSKQEQPECYYKFELNKEEKEKFFNEFLQTFLIKTN